jgi:TolB protein
VTTVRGFPPVWSPDGQWITFTSTVDNRRELYRIQPDGSRLERLTTSPYSQAANFTPAWSPDGRWIVFVSDRDGNLEVYRMLPDGGSLQNLTHHTARDFAPVWSPDGQAIVFVSDRDGYDRVYRMRADGGDVQRLSDAPAIVSSINPLSFPYWSSRGEWLTFVSSEAGRTSGAYELTRVRFDGSDPQRLHYALSGYQVA